jgi:hypothetical protein
MKSIKSKAFAFVVLLTYLCIAIPVGAQGRTVIQNAQVITQQQRDPLEHLNAVLVGAGAATLDSSQQKALNGMLTKLTNSNGPASPPGEKTARDAYFNAIWAKDLGAATKAADTLFTVLYAHQRKMMDAQAGFAIQALSCLHKDQIAALQNKKQQNVVVGILQLMAADVLVRNMGGRTGPAVSNPGLQAKPGNGK